MMPIRQLQVDFRPEFLNGSILDKWDIGGWTKTRPSNMKFLVVFCGLQKLASMVPRITFTNVDEFIRLLILFLPFC